MTINVCRDQIRFSDIRETLVQGVLEGIGPRPEDEGWEVELFEPKDSVDYAIEIRGPQGFRCSLRLFGPAELTREFVRDSVSSAITQHTSVTRKGLGVA